MSYFTDVKEMYDTHKLKYPDFPRMLSKSDMEFRTTLHMEELMEFTTAVQANDMIGAADALADLVYVVLGTAIQLGIPFDPIWDIVHVTNLCQKTRGGVDKRGNNPSDLVKLENYVDPKFAIAKLLDPDLDDDVAVVLRYNDAAQVLYCYSNKFNVFRVYLPNSIDLCIDDITCGDLIRFEPSVYTESRATKYFKEFV